MDSNIPSCGMSTTIVQSAYQKCLELYDFVPIFLKNFLGEDPQTPLYRVFLRVCFDKFLHCLKHSYGLIVVFFGKIIPPFCWKAKKKTKKKKTAPPPFWNPGSGTDYEEFSTDFT